MAEVLSRRSFLNGALSLLAVSTFEVSRHVGNFPTLFADDKHDDTAGLSALFRKEPVIFATDKVGVDRHDGIVFHSGRFRLTNTISLPADLACKVESVEFDLRWLDEDLWALQGTAEALRSFTGLFTKWLHYAKLADGTELGSLGRRRFIRTVEELENFKGELVYDFVTDSMIPA